MNLFEDKERLQQVSDVMKLKNGSYFRIIRENYVHS